MTQSPSRPGNVPPRPAPRGRAATAAVLALVAIGCGPAAMAQQASSFGDVIRIELEAFSPEAGTITFSELPVGTRNPVFHPSTYGAPGAGVLVGFAGFFEGQSTGQRADCPPGAALTGCVTGTPLDPLRLATNAPDTMIAQDQSNPNSPSLSGSPLFNGPVSFVFDKDVAGVGLAGGYFNDRQTTAITAYDRQGRVIGGVRNLYTGMDYMALVTTDGSNRIAGIQFSLVGAEPQGFAIDDLTFALSSQLNRGNIEGIAPEQPDAPAETVDNAPRQFMYPTDSKAP
jgi:hypothetical protein